MVGSYQTFCILVLRTSNIKGMGTFGRTKDSCTYRVRHGENNAFASFFTLPALSPFEVLLIWLTKGVFTVELQDHQIRFHSAGKHLQPHRFSVLCSCLFESIRH